MSVLKVMTTNAVVPAIGCGVSILGLHPEVYRGDVAALGDWGGCLWSLAVSLGDWSCAGPVEFGWLGLASILTFAFVCTMLIVNRAAAAVLGVSRALLAFSFLPYTIAKLLSVLTATIATIGILAASISLLATHWFDLDPAIFLIILGIASASLLWALISPGAAFFRAAKTHVAARPVSLYEHPRLGLLIRKVAKQTHARMPDNVLIGLEPTFFATSASVQTPYMDKPLTGQTLHLSLPLMSLFSVDELRAVIGHELGHFSGADTVYSMRFAPAFAGVEGAVARIRDGGGWLSRLIGFPARTLLEDFVQLFASVHGRMSRDRELRADRLGAKASSPEDIAFSLVKSSVGGSVWRSTVENMVEGAKKGRFSRNAVRTFLDKIRFDIDRDKLPPSIEFAMGASIEHPTDSHPSTEYRIEQMGLDFEELLTAENVLTRFFVADRAPTVLDNLLPIEEDLTTLYYHILAPHWKPEAPEEADGFEIFLRLMADFLAHMVTVDGQIDDREVEAAEAHAAERFGDFDRAGFRERCANPEDLPDLDRMIEFANSMLTPTGAKNLLETLRAIAEADGALDPREEALFAHIARSLNPSDDIVDPPPTETPTAEEPDDPQAGPTEATP